MRTTAREGQRTIAVVDFLLPPCEFQGSNLGSQVGGKYLYLLSHLVGVSWMLLFLGTTGISKNIRGDTKKAWPP